MLSITNPLRCACPTAQKTCRWAGREEAPYRSDKAVGVISSFERFRGTPSPSISPYVLMSIDPFNLDSDYHLLFWPGRRSPCGEQRRQNAITGVARDHNVGQCHWLAAGRSPWLYRIEADWRWSP